MKIIERIEVKDAYGTCCRLAAMAGEPRPNFVEWGKVYRTTDGAFRLINGFRDTGRNKYEDDNGRVRRLPKGTFHTLTAYLERVE